MKDKRHQIVAQNVGKKMAYISTLLGEAYRKLSPEERLKYVKQADEFNRLKLLTPKKAPELVVKPKRKRLSAFGLFMRKTRPQIVASNPHLSVLEYGRKLGEAWRALSEAQKKAFIDEAKQFKG